MTMMHPANISSAKFHERKVEKQKGVIVLAIMLILLAGSSYMLVKKFNANTQKARADAKTLEALKTAKQVLISYAVSYPDNINPDEGPGYLLCPDITNDGIAGGSCSDSGNTTIGRFPFKTLEVAELRDGNGQKLWYAVSDNYRNNPKLIPLNSDTPGQLQVDEINDVVAIVFAPGEPVDGQDGRGSVTEDIEDYLEEDNANHDQVFTKSGEINFNDRLLLITRTELMAAVEKRVLGDAAKALANYRGNHDALPWLSEFTNPEESSFKSDTKENNKKGHIPYHWSEETGAEDELHKRNPFNSEFDVAWNLSNGVFASDSTDAPAPPEACTRSHSCMDPVFGNLNSEISIEEPDGLCTWETILNNEDVEVEYRDYLSCQGEKHVGPISYTRTHYFLGIWPESITYDVTRRYSFSLKYQDIDSADVNPPDKTRTRTRGVETTDGQIETVTVVLHDTYVSGYEAVKDWYVPKIYLDSQSSLTYSLPPNPGDECSFDEDVNCIDGSMQVSRIRYDLDTDENELPTWFVKNDWHKLTYVVYPQDEDYPGANNGSECTPGDNCLILHWIGLTEPISESLRALVLLSGKEINDQFGARPSSDLGDYYENAAGAGGVCQEDGGTTVCNYDGNSEFVAGKVSDDFNDRVIELELN